MPIRWALGSKRARLFHYHSSHRRPVLWPADLRRDLGPISRPMLS
jgi:hypothetical protein